MFVVLMSMLAKLGQIHEFALVPFIGDPRVNQRIEQVKDQNRQRNAHGGADFLSPAGTPVHSPNAGRVVIARPLYFSGNTVIVDHGLGLFSMLAHLSAIDVREGERVNAGHVVGKVGATGRVTGAHLHWTVRAADARVDPLSLLAVLGAASP